MQQQQKNTKIIVYFTKLSATEQFFFSLLTPHSEIINKNIKQTQFQFVCILRDL